MTEQTWLILSNIAPGSSKVSSCPVKRILHSKLAYLDPSGDEGSKRVIAGELGVSVSV